MILHVSIDYVYKLSTLVFIPSSYVIRIWIANFAMYYYFFYNHFFARRYLARSHTIFIVFIHQCYEKVNPLSDTGRQQDILRSPDDVSR